MNTLSLMDGDEVYLRSVRLQQATFCKLQPVQYKFLTLPNPKAVYVKLFHFLICSLETVLSYHYVCLTKGNVEFTAK